VQIGQVKFSGVRNFAYEAAIFTREPAPDDKSSKSLSFNMPTSVVVPLRNALNELIDGSKKVSSPPPQ
jgi:hypothetical protein